MYFERRNNECNPFNIILEKMQLKISQITRITKKKANSKKKNSNFSDKSE